MSTPNNAGATKFPGQYGSETTQLESSQTYWLQFNAYYAKSKEVSEKLRRHLWTVRNSTPKYETDKNLCEFSANALKPAWSQNCTKPIIILALWTV